MKISVYTFVDNNYDKGFYVFEMINSALTWADEIMVLDGGSTDGTYEDLLRMGKRHNKLKVFQLPWDQKVLLKHSTMCFKNAALMQCTGDWCVLQDADEVIPERHGSELREWAASGMADAYDFNVNHFYKDYSHINMNPDWYTHKTYMFKNFKGIHHGMWGIDNDLIVNFDGTPTTGHRCGLTVFVYHYGHVRPLEMYKKLKNDQHKRWHPGDEWKAYEIKDWDTRFLVEFDGKHPYSMEARINGFQ